MRRLTTDDTNSIFCTLNLFFAKDNEAWIRGGGPGPDYQDCTLVDLIGRVADKHNLDIFSRDAESLGEEMYDSLQDGVDSIEGVVALLHMAAVQAAEMRWRLSAIEDILGDEYDLDQLKEMVEAKSDDVAPVVCGQWMRYRSILWHYCSVCLEDALMSKSTGTEVLSSFCPNCGAKMDLEDDK